MDSLLVAVFVALAAVLSPLMLSALNTRQQRLMKREDYARQDVVAERAEATAEALAARQDAIAAEVRNVATRAEETAGLLVTANAEVADKVALVASASVDVADKVAVVAQNASVVSDKLDVIHLLVNSQMTAAIQSEYEATLREVAMMREVVELRRETGKGEPSSDMLASIQATELKIQELRETLAERHRQDELSKAQTVKIVAAEGLKAQQVHEDPTPTGMDL